MRIIIRHLKGFQHDRRGVSNVLVVMLSLVLVTVIVANVVLWSYQMNQYDWERAQENLKLINVERNYKFLNASEIQVINGSHLGGLTFREEEYSSGNTSGSGGGIRYLYPSGYNTLGGTQHVSGSPSDLEANDGSYMIFRSSRTQGITDYVDQQSNVDGNPDKGTHSNLAALKATDNVYDVLNELKIVNENISAKTDAFIAYRSNTGTNRLSSPKSRTWTGSIASWSSEVELPSAGSPVRWVRVAYCPVQSRGYEKIVVTLSDDRYYDAYIWNGSQWLVFNNIGYYAYQFFYRGFDVAYEHASGRALIVYSRGTLSNEIGYRIWDGTTLSQEYILDLPYTSGYVYWISLATCPGTRSGTSDDNEIAMIYLDSNTDVHGYIWTGSEWSLMKATRVWDNTAATAMRECIAVAYESLSGRAIFVWGDAVRTDNYYRIWDGTALSENTLLDASNAGGVSYWFSLKPNPWGNDMILVIVDGGRDLNTYYWNGSAWTQHSEHDGSVDTNAGRCADFAWYSPTQGLLVWGATNNQISWRTFTAPNTWSTESTVNAAGTHPWVQLKTNTRNIDGDIKVLGADLNSDSKIGVIIWNGTFFALTEAAITTDTQGTTYECFEIEFMHFGPITINYQLDLEVQWINVDPTRAHEYLCIRTGSLDAEALRVDFWNGSTWVTIIEALSPNQWNNVSVSAYLTSPIFTLRFVGSAETGDSQQSIWQIDSALLWLWDDSYSVEVEFTGTSNATESWTRLDWTVDGSFTVDNVNVTLQLFNYATNSYPTSGDGYMSYISGLANVDETRMQSITINPAYFRDSNGNWKLRIIGVKTTSEQFEFRADLIQLRVETQGEGQQQNFTYYTLSFYMNFALDLAEYPIETIHSIEAHVRLKVSDTLEGWLLEAYNWVNGNPEIIGGLSPSRYYRDYVINFGDNWQSYINTNNGTVRLILCDESPDDIQTTVDVELLTLKVILKNGTVLTLKNEGSMPVHVIAIWVNNATVHKRYNVDLFLNPGEAPPSFLMGNINLPNGDFTVRIVTERGNMAVFTGG